MCETVIKLTPVFVLLMKNILFAQTNVSAVITQVFIKVGKTNGYN